MRATVTFVPDSRGKPTLITWQDGVIGGVDTYSVKTVQYALDALIASRMPIKITPTGPSVWGLRIQTDPIAFVAFMFERFSRYGEVTYTGLPDEGLGGDPNAVY